jgi:predicted RND superfamily exporter protein
MWKYFANKILRNRLAFLSILIALTVFMAYRASRIQLSYEFAKVLPESDSAFSDYENFKKIFGEDGSVMVIGFQDSKLFSPPLLNDLQSLSNSIK